MPYHSLYPALDLPKCNVLEHLFPSGKTLSDEPIWLDAANAANHLTPRQALNWIKRLGIGLDRVGVKEGEAVLIFTPNHIFVPIAYLGTVGAKRVFSGANVAYNVQELTHQVSNTGTKLVLAHPSLVDTALKACNAASKNNGGYVPQVFLFDDVYSPPIHGVRDWREFIGSPEEAEKAQIRKMTPREAETTMATVNYSSGTTGLPKGVAVSHYNLVANLEQNMYMRFVGRGYTAENHPPERWVGFLPLYHAYGQLYANMACIKLNIPCYIMKAFNYEKFLQHIQDYRITNLQVAPPILVMLSKRPETQKYDLSSVTDVLCGAAPFPIELAKDLSKKMNVQINQGWGMTEVTCGAILVPGGTKDETGSIGHIIPNTSISLRDDAGHEVPHGHRGEMYVRGPQVMMHYWRNAAATRETLLGDGWLKTGDIAIMRNGNFWIVDRKKELIKVNALQVAPAELEAVLLEHPGITDSAVTGIYLGEEEWPRAYVTLAEGVRVTEREVKEWFAERVAKHKRLVGGVKFVEEIPKLASGKIVRKVLREWAKRDVAELERGRERGRL